jgi:hypothetical protein
LVRLPEQVGKITLLQICAGPLQADLS